MLVEQFVMAYEAEQDRLRALLPAGFTSLRPVLRINAEIRDGSFGCLQFVTPVQRSEFRGWLMIRCWGDVPFVKEGKTTKFILPALEISFTGLGIEGGCPAENDNDGTYCGEDLVPTEIITANKEYCDCSFAWKFFGSASGRSTGKTLPAYCKEVETLYPRGEFTVENFASIACEQVLGAYRVCFEDNSGFRVNHV